jgi:hypothetical protein
MLDFAVLTGVTVALTQLIKPLMTSKWVPLTSVALAVGLSAVLGYSEGALLIPSLFQGLIAGLAANGLYDNVAAHLPSKSEV